jgi:hypothetical protein
VSNYVNVYLVTVCHGIITNFPIANAHAHVMRVVSALAQYGNRHKRASERKAWVRRCFLYYGYNCQIYLYAIDQLKCINKLQYNLIQSIHGASIGQLHTEK